ncbi:MAG: TetR/AcrR family transcriptional regulator [Candidatus Aminicenantia bacterium]
MVRSRERIRVDKEELIFSAALKVFATEGLDGASMQEIAKEAGLGRATVYYHFPSKKVILREILLNTIDAFFKEFLQNAKYINTEGGLYEKIVEHFVKFFNKNPLFTQLYFMVYSASRTTWLKEILKELNESHRKWLTEIEDAFKGRFKVNQSILAIPMSFSHGLGLLFLSSKDKERVEKLARIFVNIMKKAVKEEQGQEAK